MYERLSRVIREEMEQLKHTDALEEEAAAHAAFALERVRLFTGRTGLLRNVAAYLRRDNPRPLVLHGHSGCGKSALMAKASTDAAGTLSSRIIITRFIGATPLTTDARSLLDGLCRQIDRDYGQSESIIPGEYKDLITAFRQRLTLATAKKPLVLFLDALDQLSDADRGRNLMWLPMELPPNVRLVVSTLPGECLDILEKKLRSRNLVEVQPMPSDSSAKTTGGRDARLSSQWPAPLPQTCVRRSPPLELLESLGK